jgi:hypothetical protein
MKTTTQLTLTAIAFLLLGIYIAGVLLPGSRNTTADTHCGAGEKFTEFLQRFNDDLMFQQKRTQFPLIYVTRSHEEEVAEEEEEMYLIERAQWMPLVIYDTIPTVVQVLPAAMSDPDALPCEYLVVIKGINHGLSLTLRFIPRDGEWFLHTFEDGSF